MVESKNMINKLICYLLGHKFHTRYRNGNLYSNICLRCGFYEKTPIPKLYFHGINDDFWGKSEAETLAPLLNKLNKYRNKKINKLYSKCNPNPKIDIKKLILKYGKTK